MTYFAIFVGMICGYVLRFFKAIFPKKKKTGQVSLKDTFAAIGRGIAAFFTAIVRGIGAFFSAIGRVIDRVKQAIARRWQRRVMRLLAHDNIYICAKVAQSYSEPNHSVRLLSYGSIKEHCKISGDKYTVVEKDQHSTVCMPAFYEKCAEKLEEFPIPEIYVAELNHVDLAGGSSILMTKNECLYDPFVTDTDKRLDIKFSNILGKKDDKLLVEIAPTSRTVSTGIFMMGFASYNYYHLTIEILSRLKYVDDIPEYRRLPLLVDEVMLSLPQYRRLVEHVNIYKHPVIPIKQGEVVHIKKLIYPAYNTWMPINVKERESIRVSDFLIAPSALKNLQTYTKYTKTERTEKIFISRRNLAAARMSNEKSVAALFKKNGFRIVCGEDLTYDQQVRLFHKAKCVVATSGAALTNIVYCQPGTDIVCIIPEEYQFYMYSTIAHLLQQNPIFLDAKVTKRTAYTASDEFALDIEYCKRFLRQYATGKLSDFSANKEYNKNRNQQQI